MGFIKGIIQGNQQKKLANEQYALTTQQIALKRDANLSNIELNKLSMQGEIGQQQMAGGMAGSMSQIGGYAQQLSSSNMYMQAKRQQDLYNTQFEYNTAMREAEIARKNADINALANISSGISSSVSFGVSTGLDIYNSVPKKK